ncbi:TRAP transporter substrate-binding protein DctP [Litchfieldella xinjiangensis]|uniref:TRAP transporter substrate-binding protein DctP n=1 Tax=Litchfieldella xinjiangensis TaxID=1166948 RepID=UPI0005BAC7A3|nr:TRAP transporter substrate-binding protein DctP [Halomonas xinjiangensis]
MFKKTLVSGVVVAVAAFAGATQARPMTMLSSWEASYNAVPVFAEGFMEEVEERSEGDLSIRMRGPETVSPFEQLQPVSTGMFDFLFTHGAYHLGETGMAFGMDAVKDDPEARRESGIYELIDEHYQNEHNLKLIGVFSAASGYHFLLRDPIGESGDLSGMSIRASATYHDMVQDLNGAVVTLPASEIYSALDRGVVDGAAWPVFGAMDYSWYEVADYMTRPTFGVTNLSLFMNLDSWNNLAEEDQNLILEVAHELEISGREHFETLWAEEDAAMQEAGLEITEFGPEVAPQVDAIFAEGIWKQVRDRSGQLGAAFHERALEAGLTAE